MEIRIVDFVTIVASLASTGGIAAAGIRYLQRKDRDPKVIAGSLAAMLIVVLVAVLVSRTTTITVNNHSTISVPPVLSLGVATPAVTVTPRPTSAPLPTSTPSLNAYPLLSDGVYNENVRLSCGDCDAPLLVTITQIAVDSAHDEMTWTFVFYNHSGLTCSDISFNPLTLTDQNGVTFTLSGPATTDNNVTVSPGQSAPLAGIFSFVAHSGAPYTLSAVVATGGCGVTNYGPQVITL